MRIAAFTLLEVLVVLLVVAVLLGLGAPAFREFLLDSRRTADINAFVLAVQLARSEAAKRGRSVVLCPTADWAACNGEARFEAGWMVFVDEDGRKPLERTDAEPLLYAHTPELEGSIAGNRGAFEFHAYQRRSTNGTVVFCDARGPAAARAVIVSYTGRPRVDSVDPGGRPLTCAPFP